MSQTLEQVAKYYDENGAETSESFLNLAKHLSLKGVDRYYVKFFDAGSQRGTPVNPLGVGFSYDMLKPQIGTGLCMASFRNVDKEVFDIYLKFLSTKNELYHRTTINMSK